MNLPTLGSLLVAATLATSAAGAVTTTVVDVPVARGTQRFLYLRPDAPIANIVSIAGGDGILGIQNDGTMTTPTAACNPIARNRQAFAEQGFAVALVDMTSAGTVYGFEDVREVVGYMQARDNVPTWLIGGSSSTAPVANIAINLPSESPVGVVFFSPSRPTSQAALIKRPTLVVYHPSDTDQSGVAMFNALTLAPVRERVALTGGNNGGCGFHLFNGLDSEFVTTTSGFIKRNNAFAPAAAPNFQALWYRAPAESEAGWGVNVTHQGDTLFATWFTYDLDGSQMWLVGPSVRRTSGNSYTGELFRTTGPAFSSVPFNPAQVAASVVGTVTFTFTDASNGMFNTTVNGVSQSRPITRQVFSTVPTCTAGGSPGPTPNFQDLWYRSPAESESGWGVNLAHQGDILFATWFTYDTNGRGIWMVGPAVRRTTGNTFSGSLYRTTGPAYSANPWNPAGVDVTEVGTATFAFADSANGTFTYTVGGITQTKPITRQVYGSPTTVCR